jgi:septal ring factor EnvC (AmiA/AmiB activator)
MLTSKTTITVSILLLAGMYLIINPGTAGASSGHSVGIVTAKEIRVQSEPGKHGLLQKTLRRGTRVTIIRRRQDWIQILHDGEVGFIRHQAQLIKILPKRKSATAREASKKPSGQQRRLDEYENRKKYISREIKQGQQEVEAFSRKERDTIKRLEQIDQALNQSRKRTAATRSEIKEMEGAIRQASTASDKLRKRIRANEKYVARRLVALYKMSWLGKFHILASAESMHEFIQRKAALERILVYDEKVRRELIADQAELIKVLSHRQGLKDQKSIRVQALKKQTRLMSQEKSIRAKLLVDIRSQKALELAAIDALTQAANELDRKINLLNTRINRPAPAKNVVRLPFSAHKGLLIQPVNGRIISLYGLYKNPKYNITNFRSGIDIKADNGEPVRAVFKGKVLYASWFKTYGNMIIIDHANNYYTVYAHLEEAFKAKGDDVETGEVIATVGDTGSMIGAKLYFEVRHHGKPVNPMPWLKKG